MNTNTKAARRLETRKTAAADTRALLRAVSAMALEVARLASDEAELVTEDNPNVFGVLGDAQDLAAKLVEMTARRLPIYQEDEQAARDAVRRSFGLK
jgi:hypothetical protein